MGGPQFNIAGVLIRRWDEDTDTRRGRTTRRQGGDGCLQATERGLEGTEPANTLISDFQPSERWENTFSLVHLDLWVLGAGVFLLLRLRLVKSEESIVELLSLFWDGASVIMTSVTWKAVCPELVPMRLSGKREDSKRAKKVETPVWCHSEWREHA